MWASVRLYARRYVATVVAIVVGVGFIVTIDALSSAVRGGLLADATAQYVGTGTVVSEVPDVAAAARVLAGLPGTATVNAQMTQPLAVNGRTVTATGQVATVATEPALRWQHLTAGRFPAGPGQALADVNAAHQNHVRLGDSVTVGRGQEARTVRVTGFASSSTGLLSAPLYLTWPDLAAFPTEAFVQNVVTTSRDTDAVRASVPRRLAVDDRDDYLQAVQVQATQGVDTIAVMLLVFAAVAFFVSGLVIANTFSVLLAQRVRDFALLRCVGATRRQVRR